MSLQFPGFAKRYGPFGRMLLLLLLLSAGFQTSWAQYDYGIDKSPVVQRLSGSSLVNNATLDQHFTTGNESYYHIRNVVSFYLDEENTAYLPENFTASITVKVSYGHSSYTENYIEQQLTIGYDATGKNTYQARQYIHFEDAEYVRVTIETAPTATTLSNGVAVTDLLSLENEMQVRGYYDLNASGGSTLTPVLGSSSATADELTVNWSVPSLAGNNAVQLEWTWLEDELAANYTVNGDIDEDLLFRNNATRLDLPFQQGSYAIPLLYNGQGKLYYRVRAVSFKSNGTRLDGPWCDAGSYVFAGHSSTLNWQATTSYAEEGKRKTVVSYFDGSLRSRQTVTKDNVNNTTVSAETFYDGQGRPAIQLLPAPGIGSVIAYTKNLNLFNNQAENTDPAAMFDLESVSTPGSGTPEMTAESSGAAKYYSSSNPEMGTGSNANLPAAEGYPYSVTRYTPDNTGRIAAQSGVGESLKMGSGHEVKYYYGGASREELDGLFGTEAGIYTHYFKDMVKDANGQMSVSYTDMHGRTIATALAGDAPENLTALSLNATDYPNQSGTEMTRQLLDPSTNRVKNNSIESVSTILVPATTAYAFSYHLDPFILRLPQCEGDSLSYPCMYDLEISITDESGDQATIVHKYNNIDPDVDGSSNAAPQFIDESTLLSSNTLSFTETLLPGSYSIRKTLTLSEASLQRFKEAYLEKALCTSEQDLIDSLYAVYKTTSGCDAPATTTVCQACMDSLGDFTSYKVRYIAYLDPENLPTDSAIHVAYSADSASCARLCQSSSYTLASIRSMMLADMIPYTGQYAKDVVLTTSMYEKYDIFSTAYNTTTQPYYQNPADAAGNKDYYYDAFGQIDATIHPNTDNPYDTLDAATPENFAGKFSYSWAGSLLPYHPEYNKLLYAEQHLQLAYDWMDGFKGVATYAEAAAGGYLLDGSSFGTTPTDPFFTEASALKSDMANVVSGSGYYQGLNLWQIANGSVSCRNIADSAQRAGCYTLAASSPSVSGLSTEEQDLVWTTFKGLYIAVRDSMLLKYLDDQSPLPATDGADLIDQGYLLHFGTQAQTASQYGWDTTWYSGDGTAPAAGYLASTTTEQVYTSRCSSYIDQWRATLLACPAISELDSTTREALLDSVTHGMEAVCEKGTDADNPYGSSTVAPSTAYDGSPRSFEEVIENVLTYYNIDITSLCNPFVIEFPKPYGQGPVFSASLTGSIDTCNCNQLALLKQEAAAAAYDTTSLDSLNLYLSVTYGDTITASLYTSMLLHCGDLVQQVCPVDSTSTDTTTCLKCRSSGCYDTVVNYLLPAPQPLPSFLQCGFTGASRCLTCDSIQVLTSEFKTYFGSPYNGAPFFTNDPDSAQLAYNKLFAQFLNYRTGLQLSWLDYAQKLAEASCSLDSSGGTQTVVCLDDTPLSDTTGMFFTEAACQSAYNQAVAQAAIIYEYRSQQLLGDLESKYRALALSAAESFQVVYTSKEYHYTLYYYDMAGNLVKTVPPKGVRPNFSAAYISQVETARAAGTAETPDHLYTTQYRYNSLNQVVAQLSPDGGLSHFWYDRLGRLVVSRNAQQAIDGNYSYTRYDDLGRIVEIGQKPQTTDMSQTISQDDEDLSAWILDEGGTREQITLTGYDLPFGHTEQNEMGTLTGELFQQHLRGRVSYMATMTTAADNNFYAATYYTYDVHGNVDTLLQFYPGVTVLGADNYKHIAYEYDLISGKVNLVTYEPGGNDQFYHRYRYDAENRLTEVETSRDSLYWEQEASYDYYKHGPLARSILGQQQVQGLDYSYTLQGWLKGVNPVFGGMGSGSGTTGSGCASGTAEDDLEVSLRTSGGQSTYVARNSIEFTEGFESVAGDSFEAYIDPELEACVLSAGDPGAALPYASEDYPVAKDAIGFSLNYYTGDYKPIGSPAAALSLLPALGDAAAPLYNGNIAAMSVTIPTLGDGMLYNYHYDQLNRLVNMDAYNNILMSAGNRVLVPTDNYRERVSYDPNGNIMSYLRYGTTAGSRPLAMDSLTYSYYTNTNQLQHVADDPAYSSNYSTDIDNQSTGNNYTYDAIGNLLTDAAEGTTTTWTVYGKIASVTNSSGTITYTYDAAGNRITKTVGTKTTVYVRDATGNVMAVYEKDGTAAIAVTETDLYGSSRLGIQKPEPVASESITLASTWDAAELRTFTRGEKLFELSNHLGNVLATISDRKMGVDDNADEVIDAYTAVVMTANDYYPFGMLMPGRGYAGQECDQVTEELSELVVASDLDDNVTINSAGQLVQGDVNWRPMAGGSISYYNNEAVKVVMNGGTSDGVLAYLQGSMVAPNTTYVMEFDITGYDPGISEIYCQAIKEAPDGYIVSTVQSVAGHHSIVFTTASGSYNYICLRVSSKQATAGLYFIVDNFTLKKYTAVNQVPVYTTDFDDAVMDGVNVDDDGQEWTPYTTTTTSLDVTGTTDKKIYVDCSTVDESYIQTEMDLEGGEKYLLKFGSQQEETDKRLYLDILARINGVWEYTEFRSVIFVGPGNYTFNFTFPAGADRARFVLKRANSGSSYDGYDVPYTIEHFYLTRVDITETHSTLSCDPGNDPDALYRYGFNGKENDNEVKGTGNQQDYGMRIYDPRLGRFLSVDPLINKYPELAPYQYASNMPVIAVDLDGEEGKIVTIYHGRTGKELLRMEQVDFVQSMYDQSVLTIHKYPVPMLEGGISWRQVGPAEWSYNTPVNFQTGRIDLTMMSLGKLSEEFESAGVGTVSTGKGDNGGVSYGCWQLASKMGRPTQFLDAEGSEWAGEFGDYEQGTKEFSAVWKKIAKREPGKFKEAQHAYIKRTHYDVVKAHILKDIGLDIDSRSAVLRDVLWSTAVQHGPDNTIFQKALAGKDINSLSDEDIINLVYDERGRTDEKGIPVHFRKSSTENQKSVIARFKKERKRAINRLK